MPSPVLCCDENLIMKYALVCSAYAMADFVKLNLHFMRDIFGTSPILVSDDKSDASPLIESAACKYEAAYICTRVKKGHFAGDLQSIINGLVFAESNGCDVLVKCSQRFILLDKQIKGDLDNYCLTKDMSLGLPQKLHPGQTISKSGVGFCQLPILTDCIVIRVGKLTPEHLLERYKRKVMTEKFAHSSYVEAVFNDFRHEMGANCVLLNELSTHLPGVQHRFLRKVQNHRQQYIDIARSVGIDGSFDTREWAAIHGANYRPRPVVL